MYAGALGVGLGDEEGYTAAAELKEGDCHSDQGEYNERAEDSGEGRLMPLAVLTRLQYKDKSLAPPRFFLTTSIFLQVALPISNSDCYTKISPSTKRITLLNSPKLAL